MSLKEIFIRLFGYAPKKEYDPLRDHRIYVRVTEQEKE